MQKKNNPEKKRDTCISFIEKTRSEFCTIAKKKLSLTNNTIKEKVLKTLKNEPRTEKSVIVKTSIKADKKTVLKELNSENTFNQFKKSPRKLAILFQQEMKNLKKLSKEYLISR